MVAFVRNCLVKLTLRPFQPISVVMAMVSMLLRQFRKLAQGHRTGVVCQLTKIANFSYTYEKNLAVYPQEHLVVMRDEKVSPFVKFEIIQPLLCFL